MSTIAKYDKPILFSYTYPLPLSGAGKEHTLVGEIPPEQDTFAMEPGSKLLLKFPESSDAQEAWTVKTEGKNLAVKDMGCTKEKNQNSAGGSGYHIFQLEISGASGATPVHFVLTQFGKMVAEKTLKIETAYT
jgi:predicted secreted protein